MNTGGARVAVTRNFRKKSTGCVKLKLENIVCYLDRNLIEFYTLIANWLLHNGNRGTKKGLHPEETQQDTGNSL